MRSRCQPRLRQRNVGPTVSLSRLPSPPWVRRRGRVCRSACGGTQSAATGTGSQSPSPLLHQHQCKHQLPPGCLDLCHQLICCASWRNPLRAAKPNRLPVETEGGSTRQRLKLLHQWFNNDDASRWTSPRDGVDDKGHDEGNDRPTLPHRTPFPVISSGLVPSWAERMRWSCWSWRRPPTSIWLLPS